MATRKFGNYQFEWTDLHLPREKTDPLRYEYDELGGKVVEKLQEIAKKQKEQEARDGRNRAKTDLYALLSDNHKNDETLTEFWNEVHNVPGWVDWAQLERGQKFFYRYAPANLMGFALQGFVGENSAASGVVEVLIRTGGFSTRVLLRRLLETFQFLLEATQSLEAIKPGGDGHITTVRVRLLHSSVRQRIMKLVESRPDYFDVQKFGVPVNKLDSIHSITTFACNHMWLQLPLMGVYPSQQEIADYIALFRYLGYVLGTPDHYFDTVPKAKAAMESMLIHELHVTPTSLIVGHNFIECLKDLPPFNISTQFIEAGSRVLNGDDLCDSLGLGRPGWYSYACFRGHCWLVQSLALAQQNLPSVDHAITEFWKGLLHKTVIQSKGGLDGGTKFDFKHIPRVGRVTGRQDNGRPPPKRSLISRPVETFYFGVFLTGCLMILGVIWSLWRVVLVCI
jgi:ribosomal protein S28E/S33